MTRSAKTVLVAFLLVCIVAAGLAAYLVLRPPAPTTGLVLELDAEGNGTLVVQSGSRIVERRTGLRWPDDMRELVDIFASHIPKAPLDDGGYPELRLRLMLPQETTADIAYGLAAVCVASYLSGVVFEVGDLSVNADLQRDEGWTAIPAFGKPKDLIVAEVTLPADGEGQWTLSRVLFKDVIPVCHGWEGHVLGAMRDRARGVAWGTIRERHLLTREQVEKALLICDDGYFLDVMSHDRWQELLRRASSTQANRHESLDEMRLTHVGVVCIHCGRMGKAYDVVRVLLMLQKKHPGLRAYLVGPPQGDDG